MNRVFDLAWQWLDRPGLECARVECDGDAIAASGLAVTVLDEKPLRHIPVYNPRLPSQTVLPHAPQ